MDYVDLYIIHRWDYDHPIEETMEALNELVKSKKVRSMVSIVIGESYHFLLFYFSLSILSFILFGYSKLIS